MSAAHCGGAPGTPPSSGPAVAMCNPPRIQTAFPQRLPLHAEVTSQLTLFTVKTAALTGGVPLGFFNKVMRVPMARGGRRTSPYSRSAGAALLLPPHYWPSQWERRNFTARKVVMQTQRESRERHWATRIRSTSEHTHRVGWFCHYCCSVAGDVLCSRLNTCRSYEGFRKIRSQWNTA